MPYDRPLTTMAGFEMCAACRAEYEDPASRRFHAQPNACPACGPTVRLIDRSGRALGGARTRRTGDDALAAAAAALVAGRIVAVKGLGGYQLACRADDERAVAELRRRKRREEKPFALMAADVGAAGAARRSALRPSATVSGPRAADRDRAPPPRGAGRRGGRAGLAWISA